MTLKKTLILTMAIGFVAMGAVAQAADTKHTYVGVKNCKMCHNKAETGKQFEVWSQTAHAKAYESLASPEAKAKAKEMGIADPQKDAKCLSCHVSNVAAINDTTQKLTAAEGVSCEACHGAGSAYKSKKVMEEVAAGTVPAASVGLLKPNEATCTNCHKAEGNPFHKEFKYEEYLKKIAHPNPAKKKS
ncbi:MAG TPA: cytochrome c family protein [Candidatus Eisenbacteria bacterium]|nr:cytochrome c family protein [Candidatus Eisenbacteria bacterium]